MKTSSDYRRIARENLAGNWLLSIGVAAVVSLLGGLLLGSSFIPEVTYKMEAQGQDLAQQIKSVYTFSGAFGNLNISFNFLGLAQFILGGVIQLGYTKYLLKQHNKAAFSFHDVFSEFDRFAQGFAQRFLRNLYEFLWGLLFVIPGIVKHYSYAMTPFIMAENPHMSASEAIDASKQLMEGHKGALFLLDLSFIGWDILANFTLGINAISVRIALGHLALNPYKNAAHAAFYKDLTAPGATVES